MSAPVPTRRSPTGYVAQRLFPEGKPLYNLDGEPCRWLLTRYDEDGGLLLDALTDDEVADWPPLTEEGAA